MDLVELSESVRDFRDDERKDELDETFEEISDRVHVVVASSAEEEDVDVDLGDHEVRDVKKRGDGPHRDVPTEAPVEEVSLVREPLHSFDRLFGSFRLREDASPWVDDREGARGDRS